MSFSLCLFRRHKSSSIPTWNSLIHSLFGINRIHFELSKSYLLFEDYLEYKMSKYTIFLKNQFHQKFKRLIRNKEIHFILNYMKSWSSMIIGCSFAFSSFIKTFIITLLFFWNNNDSFLRFFHVLKLTISCSIAFSCFNCLYYRVFMFSCFIKTFIITLFFWKNNGSFIRFFHFVKL